MRNKNTIYLSGVIKSKEEYEHVKGRVEAGEKWIKENGGFLNEANKGYINAYQKMAEMMLAYETENDLLPF